VAHSSQLEVVGGIRQQSSWLNIFPQKNIQKHSSVVTFLSDSTQTPPFPVLWSIRG